MEGSTNVMTELGFPADYGWGVYDDLRGEPRRQAEVAAQQRKCGTCQRFIVRPPEVDLARAARPAGACGPAQYCFGGAVRGSCTYHGQQRDSTDLCPFYRPGGPGIRGMDGQVAGSLSQGSANAASPAAPPPAPSIPTNGWVLFAVALLTVAGIQLARSGSPARRPPPKGGWLPVQMARYFGGSSVRAADFLDAIEEHGFDRAAWAAGLGPDATQAVWRFLEGRRRRPS